MAHDLQNARAAIERQIAELEAHVDRLKRALAYLDDVPTNAIGATEAQPRRQSTAKRTPSGKRVAKPRPQASRVPRGERQKQFLALVSKQPGVKAAEVAKELGISPNQVHGLAHRLARSGQIKKQARGGYALAG